jgi:hypothetical protein
MRAFALVALCVTSAAADPLLNRAKPTTAPVGTTGACQADAKVADLGDEQQPAKLAGCPTPMEYERGNGFGDSPVPDVTGALPPWNLSGALQFACAYACAPSGAHAAMLGWSVYQDDRPLRNDNVAYVISDDKAHAWTVVVMWRHAFNKWWNIDGSIHDPRVPIRTFDHAPTAAEIESMLEGNRWNFSAAQDGFKLMGGRVIDASWPSAPPKHFPKP